MVLALEKPLRSLVNSVLSGKDQYGVLRSAVIWAALLKFLLRLRRITKREGLKTYLIDALTPALRKVPQVRRKLNEEMAGQMASFREKFSKELTEPRTALPIQGMSEQDIFSLMATRKELDTKHWKAGKVTGAVYHGEESHYDFIAQVYGKWGFANPLHPGIHPALRQMDSEVVQMVINMYNGGPECCGAFTTGGTESILMAMKTYRDWARAEKGITDPNIVICKTAHAAFDKAGQYFNIFVKHARTNDAMEVDLKHMKSLIDGNTVAIVGSCCQYAHGTVDPIEDMAKLALSKNIGLHVDCCLGGFLVPFMDKAGFPMRPFDFRVKGVTSISCDPHKYGFAPKGCSVVMFASKRLRHFMYCYLTKWSGGIYATPTMTGSRAGGPVAAAWASMCRFGEEGYIETTKQIVGATRKIAQGIEAMEGVRLVGRADVCSVAFAGADESINCYGLADCMQKKFGWELATCQDPPCAHISLTLPTSKNADQFLADLRASVEDLRADSAAYTETAGLYGMASSLPTAFLDECAATYLDAVSEAHASPPLN